MLPFVKRHPNLFLWLGSSLLLTAGMSHLMLRADDKTALLPGDTTHGHYQIEMQCVACHDNEKRSGFFTSAGVSNQACNNCHGEDLETFGDSHPTRKFKNPENAIFLEHLDATQCISCHQEHDEKITGDMGVSLPSDYCAHCHEVTLENLPSHQNLPFSSCATAGCHNYHDNIALSPSYLLKHYGEPKHYAHATLSQTTTIAQWILDGGEPGAPLDKKHADAPPAAIPEEHHSIITEWSNSSHAKAGINCSACHTSSQSNQTWIDRPDHSSCQQCHSGQVESFLKGKHGMRLANNTLTPMTPGQARLPMNPDHAHSALNCASCHDPHQPDKNFAAQEACLQCHQDNHSKNYLLSSHAQLWQQEVAGTAPKGSGVSCATCHLPRTENKHNQWVVNHNQSDNLRPNEKMVRNVCTQCHGLQFSQDAITDSKLIEENFSRAPHLTHPGIQWTVESAISKGNIEIIERKAYLDSLPPNQDPDPNWTPPSLRAQEPTSNLNSDQSH